MKKIFEKHIWDVLLLILLLISIGLAIHSCIECNNRVKALSQSKEYDIPTIRK